MSGPDQQEPYRNEAQPTVSMQQLMNEVEDYKMLRRGDVVSGVVVRKDRDGVLVDVGAKTEGVIPSREMRTVTPEELEHMEVGEEVLTYVVQSEDESEQSLVLSIDKAQGERGWHRLQQSFDNGDLIEAEAIDYNRGGLLANIEGVRGFVPMSQLVSLSPSTDSQGSGESPLVQLVGKPLKLKIIEVNRRRNRLILSEKQVLREERERQRDKLFSEVVEGEVRKGKVTGIREFGAFVDIGGVDGLIHLSEFSWGRAERPEHYLKVGDEVDTYVLKVDNDAKKIALSLRRLQPEPWETIHEKYHVNQLVTGTVTKVTSFGAFAQLEGSIEGLIHISELSDRPIRHPEDVVKEGDVLPLTILRIEAERRRLALSLRQAAHMGTGYSYESSIVEDEPQSEDVTSGAEEEVSTGDVEAAVATAETPSSWGMASEEEPTEQEKNEESN